MNIKGEKSMNIQEARESKARLERDINELLERYQIETGLKIDHLALEKIEFDIMGPDDKDQFLQVRVEVRL